MLLPNSVFSLTKVSLITLWEPLFFARFYSPKDERFVFGEKLNRAVWKLIVQRLGLRRFSPARRAKLRDDPLEYPGPADYRLHLKATGSRRPPNGDLIKLIARKETYVRGAKQLSKIPKVTTKVHLLHPALMLPLFPTKRIYGF